jgi:ABC-2 type transport system ATP-binding protein
MRQRLGLAAALLRSPRLLVLDEPTNGLDPQGIREIRDLLLRLNAAGTTIFLSSHLLAEVEQMCGRVGVLDRGRLVLQERLDVLQRPTGRLDVRTPDVARARALLDGQVEAWGEGRLLIRYEDAAALNSLLVRDGVRVEMLAPERRSLEDVVLEATEAGSDRVARP